MSLNLTLHDGETEEQVELWQTPTFITHMCLSGYVEGSEWILDGGEEGARRRYLIWVASQCDGTWHSADDLNSMRERVKEHSAKVQAVKNPRFSLI